MINVSDEGNVTIRISTGGNETGDTFTVYPYIDGDPTLQSFKDEDQKAIKEMSIGGRRETGDFSGKEEQKAIGDAVALLLENINQAKEKGLTDYGLKVRQIDVDPKSTLATYLEVVHGIRKHGPEGKSESEKKA
jgi:hypothetical protein